MAKVSIIMGIYNCASTLPEAIDSILEQTYTDWKMIMCDDASTDNTYSMAESYVNRFPEKLILIKNQQNMGLNYTLNHCLKYVEGEYVARMDGDDVSLPERLEKEVRFLDAHPEYAIVSMPMHYFDEDGIFMTGSGSGEPIVKNMVKGTPFCHAPCMVRREAYETVDGYSVDKKLLRVEDWHLWIKMYAAGYKGYVLSEPLYMMRDDREAIRRRKFKYQINQFRVACFTVKDLRLSPVNYVFTVRPLIVGLMPRPVYIIMHRKRLKGYV
ncbi:MAG: glycosyltransferase [Lachnospiraceae bacterium]|nr:glycosyltransferase [Lachnospiraceae bacterium]